MLFFKTRLLFSAASLQATLTPHDIAIYGNPLASFVPVKQ